MRKRDELNIRKKVTNARGQSRNLFYDAMGRITGFEYIYDDLSRIVEEKVLANSSKICYTYDVLGRVTTKTVRDLNTNAVVSTENYSYDAAGNVVCAPDGCYIPLTVFDGKL